MTSTQLVPVFTGSIQNIQTQLCNAQELHHYLEVETKFADWISRRISDYGFIENEDYIILQVKTGGRGRARTEYHITLDMGKELAMVERNEKGRQIRKYFIACEKRALQNPQPNLPLAEEKKFSFEQTQAQWLRFASSWYALYNCVELLGKLDKPLHALGSGYAPQVAGCATEYQTILGVMHRLLVPMFEQFEVDPLEDRHYYKALKTLREYQPKGLGGLVRI